MAHKGGKREGAGRPKGPDKVKLAPRVEAWVAELLSAEAERQGLTPQALAAGILTGAMSKLRGEQERKGKPASSGAPCSGFTKGEPCTGKALAGGRLCGKHQQARDKVLGGVEERRERRLRGG